MNTINGYLLAKLSNIGTRSEGPGYYLQQDDYKEYLVIKQVNLWEEDPVLHPLLGQKVIITGTQQADGIVYSEIVSQHDMGGSGDNQHSDQAALAVLLKLEVELTTRIKKITTDLAQKHSADSSEQAVERENDEVLTQLKRDAEEELAKAQRAKQRIEQATYHQCEACGGEISAERLSAIPYATLCIACGKYERP